MKVKEVIELYLADREPHIASPETLHRRKLAVLTHFGDYTFAELTPQIVAAFTQKRLAGKITWTINGKPARPQKVKPSTVRGELRFLVAARNWGWRAGLVHVDMRWIAMPPESPPRERWLLRDEALAYMNAAQPEDEPRLTRAFRIVAAGLYTGARRRAIERLTWDRIRLNIKAAETFEAAEARGEGDKYVSLNFGVIDYRIPGKVVTKKKNAVAPINCDMALVLLRAHRERKSIYYADHPGDTRHSLRKAAHAAGLHDIAICHVLRHTFATWAAQAGLPMGDIAAALGDTVHTVEKRYAHVHPEYLKRVQSRRIMSMSSQELESNSALDKLDWPV